MNRFAAITASLLASVWSMHSFASSALYTFNAPIYASEVNLDGSPIASSEYLFADGDSIVGIFSYDAATLATAVNQPPAGLGPTGLYSTYQGSIQNISATIAGHSIYATTGETLIGDGDDDSTLDAVFIRAGTFNGSENSSGFSGFTLGDYRLVSFNLFTFSSAATFSSQALPSLLSNGEFITAVDLVFENDSNQQRRVQFGLGNIELTEVPLPSSAWLFSSAALILLGRKRNRS